MGQLLMPLYSNELPLECINKPVTPKITTLTAISPTEAYGGASSGVNLILTGTGFDGPGVAQMHSHLSGVRTVWPATVNSPTQMTCAWPRQNPGYYAIKACITGNLDDGTAIPGQSWDSIQFQWT